MCNAINSYKRLGDIVDYLFPPRHSRTTEDSITASSDYNSFSYWRNPVPLLETDLIADFVRNRDAAAAANAAVEKSNDAKKAAAKKTISTTLSAPTLKVKSSAKPKSKLVAK